MAARVSRLEEDVGEIKAALRRIEPMMVQMLAVIPHLATKADLKADIGSVRDEMHSLRTDLKDDMNSLRTELKDDMNSLRMELKDDMNSLRADMKADMNSLRIELKDEINDVRVALADKPSRAYMSGIVTAMVGAFACGLGGLAILK
jgi:chromosome segregation ATPase